MARFDSILEAIGNTPLIRLNGAGATGVNVFAKLESMNPTGSVKDRMAHAIIEDAERRGKLRPGQTVIEATSGNTGIGLAMVCARKGYPLIVTMAESFSVERRKLLRFLGARVVLTPASEKGTGMVRKAIELAAACGAFFCRQFENEVNADIHTETTAREIIRDLEGETIDYFVSGFGTGGTLKGVARGLRAFDDTIRIVAAEPDNAPLLGSGIVQKRLPDGRPAESHPSFRPHLMQGWAPDFVSKLTEDAMAAGWVDDVVAVPGGMAMDCARDLARREGILVGPSSGATLAAALQIAEKARPGSNIVCMLPDTGERYLSTPLFEDIGEEMNEEELRLSRSTPGQRFDLPAAPPPGDSLARSAPNIDTEAIRFVHETVKQHRVVMFALEWCEFCWSARKLFSAMGVDYHSVDLDSVALQKGDQGGKIRAVLADFTGERTIPQIFVGGKLVGGCTDLFSAYESGDLAEQLARLDVQDRTHGELDVQGLLPGWLHTRVAN